TRRIRRRQRAWRARARRSFSSRTLLVPVVARALRKNRSAQDGVPKRALRRDLYTSVRAHLPKTASASRLPWRRTHARCPCVFELVRVSYRSARERVLRVLAFEGAVDRARFVRLAERAERLRFDRELFGLELVRRETA